MKILFVTLSNIGDVILTLPGLDLVREAFPGAEITVLSSPRASGIFTGNPSISRFIAYNKHVSLAEDIRLFLLLQRERFDLVIDLRGTLFGLLLGKKRINNFFGPRPASRHFAARHLYKVRYGLLRNFPGLRLVEGMPKPASLAANLQDERYIDQLLRETGLEPGKFVVVSPGARSSLKRWPAESFSVCVTRLSEEYGLRSVLVGEKEDAPACLATGAKAADFCGKTSMAQLACLLKKSRLLLTNDSANLHCAGYFGVPAVAIFGPTDEKAYGPWEGRGIAVTVPAACRPCMRAQCVFPRRACMEDVSVESVMQAARKLLTGTLPMLY